MFVSVGGIVYLIIREGWLIFTKAQQKPFYIFNRLEIVKYFYHCPSPIWPCNTRTRNEGKPLSLGLQDKDSNNNPTGYNPSLSY